MTISLSLNLRQTILHNANYIINIKMYESLHCDLADETIVEINKTNIVNSDIT